MNKKPTKADHAKIMALIRTLPVMYNKNKIVQQKVEGLSCLVSGIPPPEGEEFFDLDKSYAVPVMAKVNHKRYAINAFKQGGIKAVLDYCNAVVKINNEQINEKLKSLSK